MPAFAAMIYWRLVRRPLGEVGSSFQLMETRITAFHATTLAWPTARGLLRFDARQSCAPGALTVRSCACAGADHLFRARRRFHRLGDRDGGAPGEELAAMRRGAEGLRSNAVVFDAVHQDHAGRG